LSIIDKGIYYIHKIAADASARERSGVVDIPHTCAVSIDLGAEHLVRRCATRSLLFTSDSLGCRDTDGQFAYRGMKILSKDR